MAHVQAPFSQVFKDDRGKQEAEWINKVSKQLPQLKVPFYMSVATTVTSSLLIDNHEERYAATKRDYYRKPMPGMIEKHLELYNDGKPLHPDSFFVGDAAGRNRDHNGSSDFSIRCEMVNLKLILHCTTADSDRKMALSVPMTFYTPEEYFLKAKSEKYVLRRLHMNPLKTFGEHLRYAWFSVECNLNPFTRARPLPIQTFRGTRGCIVDWISWVRQDYVL